MKKILYLFLALLLPGLIFVFLKYGGKNKFDIPVYYEKGVENWPEGCEPSLEKPYRFNTRGPFSEWKPGKANLLFFPADGFEPEKIRNAILDEFGSKAVFMAEAIKVDASALNDWKRCVFLMNEPSQTVLFDQEFRIRGYYDLRTREEMDRLRVELKILLEQY